MKRLLMIMAFSALGSAPVAAQACALMRNSSSAAPTFFVEIVPGRPRDGSVRARVCVDPGKSTIGSYALSAGYDAQIMRAVAVEGTSGMQASNVQTAGVVRLAGATPNGLSKGELAVVVFELIRGATAGDVTLHPTEISTPSGSSLLASTRVVNHRAKTAVVSAAPHIDSITPRSAEVSNDRVTDLVIHGAGFAITGNVVVFDGAIIDSVASDAGGTIIRFAAPTIIPAHGDQTPHRVRPGRVTVRVRTAAGLSNPVIFTARGDDK
jgi:hypothetical protein